MANYMELFKSLKSGSLKFPKLESGAYDFNSTSHPECDDDEIFHTNLDDSDDFAAYQAKFPSDQFRKGNQAYDCKGKFYAGSYPVFRKRTI